ncbi:hypothetical protein MMC12_001647 [Toensbergia leucococca]|nr:hypothetical protein [Toensbergia leucococca]
MASLATASIPGLIRRQSWSGVATFNSFASQSNTVCGSMSGESGTYGAAASDISPDISGGTCSGSIDMSQCNGQSPIPGYANPNCPSSQCGVCYQVTNNGGYGGNAVGGGGNSVIVQIIDACPSGSAWNFCKTDVPADERCGDGGTNQLDIDQGAYAALTGTGWSDGNPNLDISISPIGCP